MQRLVYQNCLKMSMAQLNNWVVYDTMNILAGKKGKIFMSYKRIEEAAANQYENYILPFFWQHGDEKFEVLTEEIDAIYRSGIRALCVESRIHEQFGEQPWWDMMQHVLEECKKRDMKVWLLDDKHFPSGFANDILPKKYPDRGPWGITEKHMDVTGPVVNGSVLADWKESDEDEIIAILACERDSYEETLTGRVIDITENLEDGMVYLTLPEGCYRIVYLIKTRTGLANWTKTSYIDMFNPLATDAFIEAVYETHYEHFKEYFGNTFAGFFSDEPCFANNTKASYVTEFGRKYCHYPWRDDFIGVLDNVLGAKSVEYLPGLWFDMGKEKTSVIRMAFMNMLTERFRENLSQKLGAWCRERGVQYIGHVIEDCDTHAKTSGGTGHYFRAMDGMDMGGIDIVLDQALPGMTDYIVTVPCGYDVADPDFFQYTLAKLASSHSHIQPLKQGKAMCEIYGAYGWAEGLKMMKWLTDLMLVRGINYYVPHAFSPQFPDEDCPPHMYARGTNPEFPKFKILMDYMNRVSHILNGGRHVATAAVLYHAEAEWSGGKYMPMDKVARHLTENQIDFDLVPIDSLKGAHIEHGKLLLNQEKYPCLIVPYSEKLPKDAIRIFWEFAQQGLCVIYADAVPSSASDAPDMEIDYYVTESFHLNIVEKDKIAPFLRERGFEDVIPQKPEHFLRFYHYVHEDTHVYMFTNEGIHHDISTTIKLAGFAGGEYVLYDPMENTMNKYHSDNGEIPLELPIYGSVILLVGELPPAKSAAEKNKQEELLLDEQYQVSICTQEEYPHFQPYKKLNGLKNMTYKDELPRFSGHFLYTKTVELPELKKGAQYILDLGYVGECATVNVNGQHCGDKIAPPYRFDVTKALRQGQNEISIEVTNHYGYKMRDFRSRYILFEPSGLLGPVKIETYC